MLNETQFEKLHNLLQKLEIPIEQIDTVHKFSFQEKQYQYDDYQKSLTTETLQGLEVLTKQAMDQLYYQLGIVVSYKASEQASVKLNQRELPFSLNTLLGDGEQNESYLFEQRLSKDLNKIELELQQLEQEELDEELLTDLQQRKETIMKQLDDLKIAADAKVQKPQEEDNLEEQSQSENLEDVIAKRILQYKTELSSLKRGTAKKLSGIKEALLTNWKKYDLAQEEADLEKVKKFNSSQEQDLSKAEMKLKKCEQECSKLEQQDMNLKADLKNREAEITQLESEIEQLKREIDDLKKHKISLEQNKNSIIQELRDKRDHLSQKIKQSETILQSLDDINQEESRVGKIRDEIVTIKRNIETLNVKYLAHIATTFPIFWIVDDSKNLIKEKEEEEKLLAKKKMELFKLLDNIDRIKNDLTAHKNIINEKQAEIKNLEILEKQKTEFYRSHINAVNEKIETAKEVETNKIKELLIMKCYKESLESEFSENLYKLEKVRDEVKVLRKTIEDNRATLQFIAGVKVDFQQRLTEAEQQQQQTEVKVEPTF